MSTDVETGSRARPGVLPRPCARTMRTISAYLIVMSDLVSFVCAFFLAGWITLTLKLVVSPDALGPFARPENVVSRGIFFFALALAVMLWLNSHGHYRQRHSSTYELRDIVLGCVIAALVEISIHFAAKESLSRLWLTVGWMAAALLLPTFRMVVRYVLAKAGVWQMPVMVLGNEERLRTIEHAFQADRALSYYVADCQPLTAFKDLLDNCDPDREAECLERLKGLALSRDIRLVLAPEHDQIPIVERLAALLDRYQYRYAIASPLQGIPLHGLEQQYFLGQDLLLLTTSNNLQRPINRAIKRVFDVGSICAAMVVVVPVLAVFAALVKLDGGPLFYGHKRVGRDGKTFKCWKLRSMVPNADQVLRDLLERDEAARREWEADYKLRKDPRITWIGGLLRVSGIDELPQLFNVLVGEMSLVGPRPVVEDEIERYGKNTSAYFAVQPGITGLWQVSGRNDVDYGTRVALDLWYAKNWSLWLDLVILLKTFPAVLARRGAY